MHTLQSAIAREREASDHDEAVWKAVKNEVITNMQILKTNLTMIQRELRDKLKQELDSWHDQA